MNIAKIDAVGRFVIPKEIRYKLDIQPGDPVSMVMQGEYVYVKKVLPECVFCGETQNLTAFHGKLICEKCITILTQYYF
ncbi:AbrB/MazE/SpoVT family DNA-binding domain-containing protein [Zongyangia hominis]|uniref:AbrB/MazE/SpoVT family DNA-binding domain-containing protein n=1 Tax=Zongyangia hominis TaxID=2763677 RepID=A0A926EB31_9FIRM|nr:AbrB/MazE/SpoVT family DNA-binding domain-containing protein [Zongyangia hominis]MBC8570622.1 AbrB/MazE/SpoVT family DNA-binding domain-containing protein [Zongyangia hominis]